MTKNKEVKQSISIRLTPSIASLLKAKSEQGKDSQADIIEKSLTESFSGNDTNTLKARLESKQTEIDQIIAELKALEKRTGKKISRLKKISIHVSQAEYDMIRNKAHELKTSMSVMIGDELFKNRSKVSLEHKPILPLEMTPV